MRPQSLAEVAAYGLQHPEQFETACDEFCDEFYLRYPDFAAMQNALNPVPNIMFEPHKDAWIGAIGEHLAMRWQLEVPGWVKREEHFALSLPVFMPPSQRLRHLLIAESPPAFRSRMIFTFAEPLQRARFPKGVAVVQMPWEVEIKSPAKHFSAAR